MAKPVTGIRKFLGTAFICASSLLAAVPDSTGNSTAAKAQDPAEVPTALEQSHSLSILALVLPHNSLHNSKSLHDWPFFAIAVPAWASKIGAKWDFGKLLTLRGAAKYDLSYTEISLKLDASLELIKLLELGVEPFAGTGINYGETATFMGVYNPEKRDYDQDFVFTNYTYGLRYHGALTLPLLAFLPKSDWTKIILKGTADLTYSAYTGAEDGEIWKAGNANMVNGFKYRYGGTLIYILPFKRVPMAMVSASVSAFKHAYDFDPIYKDYNPGFKTINITPMVSVKVTENWNGMLMAIISRDRVFENRQYPTTEEPLQKQVGSEWDLRSILCIFTRKF